MKLENISTIATIIIIGLLVFAVNYLLSGDDTLMKLFLFGF